MSAQLKALAEPIELLEHRTMHGKTFLLPDGRVQVSSCARPFHWNDKGAWVEVDETPRSEDGEIWTTRSTPYHLSWDSERLELDFRSKRGGDVKIRLVALDGVPIYRSISAAKVAGRSVKCFAAPKLEIELRCRTHAVEIFKILHGPLAPRRLTWEVTEGAPGVHTRLMQTTGHDNLLRSERRKHEHMLNRRRLVEILHSRTEVSANVHRVTEDFTGRTRFIDPVTRARSWVNEVEWPVDIDTTVSVSITATQDDGFGNSAATYWDSSAVRVTSSAYAGFRFLTVNLPQGQTLDSAILTVNVTGSNGANTATLAGNNVDSAATWAQGSANSPSTMAATTATKTVAPLGVGSKTIDVLTICQEIVNRGGWAANNNLRLGFTVVSAMSTSYMYIEDYAAVGTAQAKIDVIYTPAAGGQGIMFSSSALDGLGSYGILKGNRPA